MDIREATRFLNDALKEEFASLKEFKGEALENFKKIFLIDTDAPIYYNRYNVVITDINLMEQFTHFLNKSDLVLRVEIVEFNVNIWVYQYFNSAVLTTYLPPWPDQSF